MGRKLALLIALVPFLPGSAEQSRGAAEVHLSLEQAVAEGKIDLEIRSLGRSTGACMKLVIQRRVPELLHLSIDSGLVFKSRSRKVQDMVGARVLGEYRPSTNTYRPDGLMILGDEAVHEFVLEAFCLDSARPTPGLQEGFLLGGLDLKARGILELGISRKASRSDLQMAIWIDRPLAQGVTLDRLMARVRATPANIEAARAILAQLEIDGIERWIGSVGGPWRGPGGPPWPRPRPGPGGGNLSIQTEIRGLVPPIGPLGIFDAGTWPEVQIEGTSGGTETRKASAEKTLLVLKVAVAAPRMTVRPDDFQVLVDGQAYPAFALARTAERLGADKTPRFDASPAAARPRRFPPFGLRWQVGFEIPRQATEGTLVWRNLVGLDWEVER